MIIESILTTMHADGTTNFAPMGVEWGEDRIFINPFLNTTTFSNLRATGSAVVNLTDDVLVFASAAISNPQFAAFPATVVRGMVLDVACSWVELSVLSIGATTPRPRIEARVVHRGFRRQFLGFNRARNAVLEAAILATRIHLIDRREIEGAFARLQTIVDKTAGPREHEAMALLTEYIARRT